MSRVLAEVRARSTQARSSSPRATGSMVGAWRPVTSSAREVQAGDPVEDWESVRARLAERWRRR